MPSYTARAATHSERLRAPMCRHCQRSRRARRREPPVSRRTCSKWRPDLAAWNSEVSSAPTDASVQVIPIPDRVVEPTVSCSAFRFLLVGIDESGPWVRSTLRATPR